MPNTAGVLGMQLGYQAADSALGQAMGLVFGGAQDRRQLRQQEKLQNLQIQGEKQLTDYNTQKQLQMWKDTSYPAQMEQIQKAGLNPALMYGMGGGGGQTANIAQGNVSGAQAANTREARSSGSQGMGLQAMLVKAQLDNINADTELKKADAANRPIQGQNIQADTVLKGIDAKLKNVEVEYQTKTLNDRIDMMNTIANQEVQKLDILEQQKILTRETREEYAKQAVLKTVQASLDLIQTKANTAELVAMAAKLKSDVKVNEQSVINMIDQLKTNQELRKQIENEIMQKWEEVQTHRDATRTGEEAQRHKEDQDFMPDLSEIIIGTLFGKMSGAGNKNPIGFKIQ